MPTRLEELETELLALPVESRATVALHLIESLDEETDENVDALWEEEIERRAVEFGNGSVECESASQVLEEARAHLRCVK